jgi:hypothetical protein
VRTECAELKTAVSSWFGNAEELIGIDFDANCNKSFAE